MQTYAKHSTEKPPVWGELERVFNPKWETTAVAYGDTIHSASPLPPDVEAHERVHLNQQGYTAAGAAEWWAKYLHDPTFRYEQELEAYRMQYTYLTQTVKDRNELARRVHKLAGDLASMYGLDITRGEALAAIKSKK